MSNEFILTVLVGFIGVQSYLILVDNKERSEAVITSIVDHGCSKQTQIELSPTKSNADVYNYAALSTSY